MSVEIKVGQFWESKANGERSRICGFDIDGDPVVESECSEVDIYSACTFKHNNTLLPGCDSFYWTKPTDAAPDPAAKAETHRILEVGEVIEDGDECRTKHSSKDDRWFETSCAGSVVHANDGNYYRRKLPQCWLCAEYPEAVYEDTLPGDDLPENDAPWYKLTLVGTVPGGRMFFLPDAK